MIKFNRHYVTNGTTKARVWYSLDNRMDGKTCVTLYAKDYGHDLAHIIPDEYRNDSDMMTDYFEKGRVVIFSDSPLFAAARARAEQIANQ